jgi:acetyl-CoA C-acetyltransferase
MSNVAIVGIGMHEFGRNDGISGMDQGVVAVRRALADCGRQWSDMQFAVGGSMDGGAADTMVSRIGLTGLPFTNVVNGCATGGTALAQP